LRIDSGFGGQHQRFGDGFNGHAQNQVVDQFEGGAHAVFTGIDNFGGHDFKYGPAGRKDVLRSADHDAQFSGGRHFRVSGYRRIQHKDTFDPGAFGYGPGHLRGNTAHIDQDQSFARALENPLRTADDLFGSGRIRYHGNYDIRSLCHGLGRFGPRCAGRYQRLRLVFGAVPDRQGISGLQQMPGHVLTHQPDTDKTHTLHSASFALNFFSGFPQSPS